MDVWMLSISVLSHCHVLKGPVLLMDMDECLCAFVLSHRLVLFPCSLEVHTAVFPALDDCPSTTGCFHVAIHLHKWEAIEEDGGKNTHEIMEPWQFQCKHNTSRLDVTLSGFNKQWRVIWSIIRFQTLLFPAFVMIHLWECYASVCPSNFISVSLSFTNSPEMFLMRGPCFSGIKVVVQTGHIPADTWV